MLFESGGAAGPISDTDHVVLRVLLGDGDDGTVACVAVVRSLFSGGGALTGTIKCELNRLLISEQSSIVVISNIVYVLD